MTPDLAKGRDNQLFLGSGQKPGFSYKCDSISPVWTRVTRRPPPAPGPAFRVQGKGVAWRLHSDSSASTGHSHPTAADPEVQAAQGSPWL